MQNFISQKLKMKYLIDDIVIDFFFPKFYKHEMQSKG